jgi:DNA polymerase III delta prime subunit
MSERKSLFIEKYKAKSLKEFCRFNQRLYNILENFFQTGGKFNLLFIGDNCSGKTLLLNILIKRYYEGGGRKEGGKENAMTLNSVLNKEVLFINNLKEQGMQFYRNEMKTFCQSQCSILGKKKMVVIDDLDTINEQGQHVFRNYMDKYSSNVIFLTVCNDLQKIIESLQSRLHVIKINRPREEQIRYILDTIIETENLRLKENAKEFILTYSHSSIRNLIGYLEKLCLYYKNYEEDEKDISLPLCKSLCSDIKETDFDTYIDYLKHDKLSKAIDLIYNLYDSGFSVIDIYELFFTYIKYKSVTPGESPHFSINTDTLTHSKLGRSPSIPEKKKYDIIKLLCYYMYIFYNSHENVVELVLFTNELYKIVKSGERL